MRIILIISLLLANLAYAENATEPHSSMTGYGLVTESKAANNCKDPKALDCVPEYNVTYRFKGEEFVTRLRKNIHAGSQIPVDVGDD